MPVLRGCCSLDLKVGTKIIGIIFLILGLIGFISSLIMLFAYMVIKDVIVQIIDQSVQAMLEAEKQHGGEITPEEQAQYEQLDSIGQMVRTYAEHLSVILIIIVVYQALEVICNSCLIHAIKKNQRMLLMPWMVTHALYILISVIILIAFIIIMFIVNDIYAFFLSSILFSGLWTALHIYLLLVVISQFQALGLIRMHDEMCMK